MLLIAAAPIAVSVTSLHCLAHSLSHLKICLASPWSLYRCAALCGQTPGGAARWDRCGIANGTAAAARRRREAAAACALGITQVSSVWKALRLSDLNSVSEAGSTLTLLTLACCLDALDTAYSFGKKPRCLGACT